MKSRLLNSAAVSALMLAGTFSAYAQETAPTSPPSPPAAQAPAPQSEPLPGETSTPPAAPSESAASESSSASSITYATQQSSDQHRSSKVVGQPVYNAAGERIGDVNELILGANGQVESAVIGVGGFLGLGEKQVAVMYKDLKFTSDANGSMRITLNSTKEALETAPDFKYADDKRM
jgi:sporulation protein YlmC with PRC-barrel domain